MAKQTAANANGSEQASTFEMRTLQNQIEQLKKDKKTADRAYKTLLKSRKMEYEKPLADPIRQGMLDEMERLKNERTNALLGQQVLQQQVVTMAGAEEVATANKASDDAQNKLLSEQRAHNATRKEANEEKRQLHTKVFDGLKEIQKQNDEVLEAHEKVAAATQERNRAVNELATERSAHLATRTRVTVLEQTLAETEGQLNRIEYFWLDNALWNMERAYKMSADAQAEATDNQLKATDAELTAAHTEDKIKAAEIEVAAAKAQVATAKYRVATAESKLADAETRAEHAENSVSKLHAEKIEKGNDLKETRADKTRLQAEVKRLEGELDVARRARQHGATPAWTPTGPGRNKRLKYDNGPRVDLYRPAGRDGSRDGASSGFGSSRGR